MTIPPTLIPIAIELGAKLINMVYEFLQAKTGMTKEQIHESIGKELKAIQDDLKEAENKERSIIEDG